MLLLEQAAASAGNPPIRLTGVDDHREVRAPEAPLMPDRGFVTGAPAGVESFARFVTIGVVLIRYRHRIRSSKTPRLEVVCSGTRRRFGTITRSVGVGS